MCAPTPVNKRELPTMRERPTMCEREAALCPRSPPVPKISKTCTQTHSDKTARRHEYCTQKKHQHNPGVQQHSNMLVPFVSIALLTAQSVLGSQWEYRIECSFLHMPSFTVVSVSLTSTTLVHALYTRHVSQELKNMPLYALFLLINTTNLF